MPQLSVRNLGKAYKRYSRKSGRMREWFGAPAQHELRWVLQDVNFDVEPGDAIGIVGDNGAGKSTLLKLITGTIQPTTGSVHIAGSISALLELGIGFHPDFTGRQNIYMTGSIAGLPPDRVSALMAEIVEFAQIGDYLDQPVRTYSSGMQVRLAFSLATVVRPDILIVDEALSVGDIFFQQKCFERIRGFRDAGTTLFFVTHSLPTVYALCSRAIYLENGRVVMDGEPKTVIDFYQAKAVEKATSNAGALEIVKSPEPIGNAPVDKAPQPALAAEAPAQIESALGTPGAGSYFSEGASIDAVRLLDERGVPAQVFSSAGTVTVEIVGRFERQIDDPHFGFQVRDRFGEALFMTTTHGQGRQVGAVGPGDSRMVRFQFRPSLAAGQYTITAGLANRGRFDGSFEEALVRHHDVTSFTVIDPADAARWNGIINLRPTVEVTTGKAR